jgi:YbgC/YbaW family acyl-CoA thioester hydrolase
MTVIATLSRTLAWGDCDPAGIIYYPTYYRWMDAATWAMIGAAGYPAPRIRAEHLTIPLVDSQCTFMSSPTFGDECEVRSQISKWGRSSFTVSHEFLLPAEQRVLARGTEARVWCRYEAGPGTALRSTPIPQDLRAALGAPRA